MSKCTPYAGCAAGAPVVIVPVYITEGLPALQMVPIDMGICIGVSPIPEFMKTVHQVLDIPENLEVFSLFALGYPAEERVQQDRFEQGRIHVIKD